MPNRTYDPAIAALKRKNAAIFQSTTRCIKNGGYTTPSGKVIRFDLSDMLERGKCFQKAIPAVDAPAVPGGTTIMVERGDCVDTTGRLVKEGYRPLLLNFASGGHPGGGVETGARAQEESICRRSTLTRSIFSFYAESAERYGYPLTAGEHYPIASRFSAIYSPSVTFFREGRECAFMEEPFDAAVVTCAALNLSGRYEIRLTRDGRMPQVALDITRDKIRTIFRIGLLYGHDALVLGAFGCGAFHNTPDQVARLFHEVIEEPEFKDKFRLITFSILDDHNSRHGNFATFKKEFEGAGQAEDVIDAEGADEPIDPEFAMRFVEALYKSESALKDDNGKVLTLEEAKKQYKKD